MDEPPESARSLRYRVSTLADTYQARGRAEESAELQEIASSIDTTPVAGGCQSDPTSVPLDKLDALIRAHLNHGKWKIGRAHV